jgi:hypothetical protein
MVISDSHFLSRLLPFCYSCISSHDLPIVFFSSIFTVIQLILVSSYSRARGCEEGLCLCPLGRNLVYSDSGVWSATPRVA